MRGYCGIGAIGMKTKINYGTLFRSAYCLNASFIFLIGRRFKKQSSDTVASYRHLPLYEYANASDFFDHIPYGCVPVAVEITPYAENIINFCHPERAVYLLGPEDGSIPVDILGRCPIVLKIPSRYCLNVAVAGSIILYDRLVKAKSNKEIA